MFLFKNANGILPADVAVRRSFRAEYKANCLNRLPRCNAELFFLLHLCHRISTERGFHTFGASSIQDRRCCRSIIVENHSRFSSSLSSIGILLKITSAYHFRVIGDFMVPPYCRSYFSVNCYDNGMIVIFLHNCSTRLFCHFQNQSATDNSLVFIVVNNLIGFSGRLSMPEQYPTFRLIAGMFSDAKFHMSSPDYRNPHDT